MYLAMYYLCVDASDVGYFLCIRLPVWVCTVVVALMDATVLLDIVCGCAEIMMV